MFKKIAIATLTLALVLIAFSAVNSISNAATTFAPKAVETIQTTTLAEPTTWEEVDAYAHEICKDMNAFSEFKCGFSTGMKYRHLKNVH